MPDLVVTVHGDSLRIDGALPPGYRLIVHNHTGESDFYSYTERIGDCRYPDPVEDVEFDDDDVVEFDDDDVVEFDVPSAV